MHLLGRAALLRGRRETALPREGRAPARPEHYRKITIVPAPMTVQVNAPPIVLKRTFLFAPRFVTVQRAARSPVPLSTTSAPWPITHVPTAVDDGSVTEPPPQTMTLRGVDTNGP